MSAMHADECILVDADDRVIGHASKLDCHLMANGPPLHRAFSVFIFNNKNELLLQQRSATKVGGMGLERQAGRARACMCVCVCV